MSPNDFVRGAALAIALAVLSSARAEVGTVTALEGESIRTTPKGESLALRVGSQLGLGDMLEVKSGNLKISLNDASEIVLASRSLLRIDEARLEKLEHRRFSAWLFVGSVWTRVSKARAGSEAKFEVVTDRMVAGVRGTTFRVDVATNAANDKETLVHVIEGRVRVAERGAGNIESGKVAKPKATELAAGETMRATKEGMQREQGAPPATESFERFVYAHQRAAPDRNDNPRNREKAPRRR
ncbi:MAG TPA: FecR family protein [Myxococcaceae bacterium]|nr:FecR family protein [Myxococcaceae bacterium]